jgi:putative membrane protein insertion efficiency factor
MVFSQNWKRLVKFLLILPIRFYKVAIWPLFRPHCAYGPSCSAYMVDAIEQWGIRGVWMGLKRIGRCHPWGGFGFDPVPKCRDSQNH